MSMLQYDGLNGSWKSTNRQELVRKKSQLEREGYNTGVIHTSTSIAYGPYYFFLVGKKRHPRGLLGES